MKKTIPDRSISQDKNPEEFLNHVFHPKRIAVVMKKSLWWFWKHFEMTFNDSLLAKNAFNPSLNCHRPLWWSASLHDRDISSFFCFQKKHYKFFWTSCRLMASTSWLASWFLVRELRRGTAGAVLPGWVKRGRLLPAYGQGSVAE